MVGEGGRIWNFFLDERSSDDRGTREVRGRDRSIEVMIRYMVLGRLVLPGGRIVGFFLSERRGIGGRKVMGMRNFCKTSVSFCSLGVGYHLILSLVQEKNLIHAIRNMYMRHASLPDTYTCAAPPKKSPTIITADMRTISRSSQPQILSHSFT